MALDSFKSCSQFVAHQITLSSLIKIADRNAGLEWWFSKLIVRTI